MEPKDYVRDSESRLESTFLSPLLEMLQPLVQGSDEHKKRFLLDWMGQEYFVSRDFPRWLAGLAFYLGDPEDRDLVVTNMWEEHGSGDPGRSHFALYGAMLESLGGDVSSLTISEHTARYMAQVEAELKGGVLSAIATLGPANEYLIRYEYGAIYELFKACGWLNAAVTDFFESNIDADFAHWDNLAAIIVRHLQGDEQTLRASGEEYLAAVDRSYRTRLFFFRQFVA